MYVNRKLGLAVLGALTAGLLTACGSGSSPPPAAQQVIRVTVNGVFVSFVGTVNEMFPVEENGESRELRGFTFTLDADDDPTAFDALLQ